MLAEQSSQRHDFLLIDNSGSIRGESSKHNLDLRERVRGFVSSWVGAVPIGTTVKIFLFSGEIDRSIPLLTIRSIEDREKLLNDFQKRFTTDGSYTHIYEAIEVASSEFEEILARDSGATGKFIVVTDGEDNDQSRDFQSVVDIMSRLLVDDPDAVLKIFTLGFKSEECVPTSGIECTETAPEGAWDPPNPEFTAEPPVCEPGCIVTLKPKELDPMASYLWEFGDGNESAEAIPSHRYTSVGVFYPKVSVKGPLSDKDVADFTLADGVQIKRDVPLSAVFFVANTNVEVGERIQFVNESTGRAASFAWDFGDETLSNERNPGHVYARPGTYEVRLVVSSQGETASTTRKIEVKRAAILVQAETEVPLILGDSIRVSVKAPETGLLESVATVEYVGSETKIDLDLFDDGSVMSGDSVAGDGVFTGELETTEIGGVRVSISGVDSTRTPIIAPEQVGSVLLDIPQREFSLGRVIPGQNQYFAINASSVSSRELSWKLESSGVSVGFPEGGFVNDKIDHIDLSFTVPEDAVGGRVSGLILSFEAADGRVSAVPIVVDVTVESTAQRWIRYGLLMLLGLIVLLVAWSVIVQLLRPRLGYAMLTNINTNDSLLLSDRFKTSASIFSRIFSTRIDLSFGGEQADIPVFSSSPSVLGNIRRTSDSWVIAPNPDIADLRIRRSNGEEVQYYGTDEIENGDILIWQAEEVRFDEY
ncbi:MAG: PKD domain-containing protein [Pseudomonadota bacterium]